MNTVEEAFPENSNDDGKKARKLIKCYLVKEINIVECDGGCGEFVMRPHIVPADAEVMCSKCLEEELEEAAEDGLDTQFMEIDPDDVSYGVN